METHIDKTTEKIQFDPEDPKLAQFFNETTFWSAPFGQLLLENIPMLEGVKLLDVGCGPGFPLLQLADRLGNGSTCYGIDPWPAAIKFLNSRIEYEGLKNVKTVLKSATEIPFEDHFFNMIVSNLGINNFDNPELVAQECRRVLHKDGILAITTNLAGHMKEFYKVYDEALVALNLDEFRENLRREENHRSTIVEIQALFAAAGFSTSQTIEKDFSLKFSSGTAFLESRFIRFSFMSGWEAVVPPGKWSTVISEIERRLNTISSRDGELLVTVPMAYLEFKPR